MLKIQIALIAILIAAVTFVSCERMQKMLEPVADDMMDTGDMMSAGDRLAEMMAMTTYRLWTSVALPAPPATGTAPAESGGAPRYGHPDRLYQRCRCHGTERREYDNLP